MTTTAATTQPVGPTTPAWADFEVAFEVFDRQGRPVSKRRSFKTAAARAAWVDRQERTNDNWRRVVAVSDPQ